MYTHIQLDYMELMTDGDIDMKKMMLEMLLTEMPEELGKMKQALEAKDWDNMSKISHKMKSTLSFVGNNAMTEANQQIELISKREDTVELLPMLVQTVETNFHKAALELQNELEALEN